ncbi:Poly(A) polymerase central domain-containing protein [Spinellus fusiger]|nr:Poly(A) polymerase central domain-containing protein [Spinellus fusiger]
MHFSIDDTAWSTYLETNGIIETIPQLDKREAVVDLLNQLVLDFSKKMMMMSRLKERPSVHLSLFGSSGLGAHLAKADIDLVLLSSWSITRRAFSNTFRDILRKSSLVKNIQVIERTNVPIIKCSVNSIMVDISFVRIKRGTVSPNIDLLDDRLLSDLDRACVASMDGPRVHRFIVKALAPAHFFIFQRALQSLKHWATQRCLYNKPMGYLNGGSWTLLLLKTYMTVAPNPMTVQSLLRSFFSQWGEWPWPTPVLLTDSMVDMEAVLELTLYILYFFQQTEFTSAIMPIVTPCYPVSSSAPYVTKSTLGIMTKEIERALLILDWPFETVEDMLNKLFKPYDILKSHQHFIKVTVSSSSYRSHDIWIRKMAMYIPHLVELLEPIPEVGEVFPMFKPTNLTHQYRSINERHAIERGEDLLAASTFSYTDSLSPGTLYLTWYIIALKISVPDGTERIVDISHQVKAFAAHVDSKKGSRDADVRVTIASIKRKETEKILNFNQT